MTRPKLSAGSIFPSIDLPILKGGVRSLHKPRAGFDWIMTIVYRGKHCPLCTKYLKEVNAAVPALDALGVDVLAVSADSEARARAQMTGVSPHFDVGYGLTIPQMQALGLYVSDPRNGVNVEGPFAEPGLFVINHCGELQIVDISNVPFSRPNPELIATGIGYLRGALKDFPINGTYA